MDKWLIDHLVCPRDKRPLELADNTLNCSDGHTYTVVDGIPVMLFDDGNPTHGYIGRSLEQAARVRAGEDLSCVFGNMEVKKNGEVDDFVQNEVPYTCGTLYFPVQHKLTRYPIPEMHLPDGDGKRLLDVGCNWGRWTIVAEQKGYRSVGIDPCLDAVLAARRVARQFSVNPSFLVADARSLPFKEDSFDISFSFGVMQHLKKPNVKTSFTEMARVTCPGGEVVVQMPNKYGFRCLYQQARLGFKDGREGADVFYWTPAELKRTFTDHFGRTDLTADGYFGLCNQKVDLDLMPLRYKAVIHASEFFRGMSSFVRPLINLADSVYVRAINQKNGAAGS
jgi:SAM-dependent methyltransferase